MVAVTTRELFVEPAPPCAVIWYRLARLATSAGQRALERIFFSLDLDMKDAGRLTPADLKAPLDAKAFGHARVQRFVDACGIDVGGGV